MSILGCLHIDSREPILFYLLRQLVVPDRSWSVWPRRICRSMNGVKLNFFHQIKGVLKLLLRLAGKTDNCIRRHCCIWHIRSDFLYNLLETFRSVSSLHFSQHSVISTLKRHVKVLTELWQFRTCSYQSLRHVSWMRGGKTYPFDAINVVDVVQQIRQTVPRPEISTIGVNVLSEENHFFDTLRSQFLNLCLDCFPRAALLQPAHAWHHTIRASLVAAVDDVHPRSDRTLPLWFGYIFHDMYRIGCANLVSLSDGIHELSKSVCVLRTHHYVHLRNPPKQLFSFLLCYAACHHNGHLWVQPLALGVSADI
mmetsp:Transcript_4037/g.12131  ORF Transcript_4037/g.12131 Transcript_4037/m.12131 type:complete len:310 (-) Transcript_4037:810-1739(-)